MSCDKCWNNSKKPDRNVQCNFQPLQTGSLPPLVLGQSVMPLIGLRTIVPQEMTGVITDHRGAVTREIDQRETTGTEIEVVIRLGGTSK